MMQFDPFKRQPIFEIEYALQVTVTLENSEQVVYECNTRSHTQFLTELREIQTIVENLYELIPRPEVTEF